MAILTVLFSLTRDLKIEYRKIFNYWNQTSFQRLYRESLQLGSGDPDFSSGFLPER